MTKSTRSVIVAVPGLCGGVDEAAGYMFSGHGFPNEWRVRLVVTKGRRSWAAPFVFGLSLARLLAWRVTGHADLLHVNLSSKGSTIRKLGLTTLARIVRMPYVIQLHGGGFADFHARAPYLLRLAIGSLFANAAHVYVLGKPFADLAVHTLGAATDDVTVLRNAVPALAAASPSPLDPPNILFTGRLGRAKGTYDLLDALATLREYEWSATLAGDGDVDGVRAKVEALGLSDKVTVKGWQSRSNVEQLLANASVFVLPSYVEALSVALLEAMAAQVCCVATAVGAQGELVSHNHNGLLFDPGDIDGLADALRIALTDPDLRVRLGKNAGDTVAAECSIDVVRSNLLATYENVLATR